MSGRIEIAMAGVSMAGGRPWGFPRKWALALRWNAMAWAAFALAGRSAASLAVAMGVHEHQVTSHLVALAGFTPIRGPGTEIVLTEGTTTSRLGDNANATLGQDGDLILLNMMLRYGGARAVVIKGERITAQSAIISSGPTLLINGRRTVGPFHVTALGDPAVLRGALETRGGVVDWMQEAGLGGADRWTRLCATITSIVRAQAGIRGKSREAITALTDEMEVGETQPQSRRRTPDLASVLLRPVFFTVIYDACIVSVAD